MLNIIIEIISNAWGQARGIVDNQCSLPILCRWHANLVDGGPARVARKENIQHSIVEHLSVACKSGNVASIDRVTTAVECERECGR